MKNWQSASVIAAVTLVAVFAPWPAFTLRAQPHLTEAQAAALQPTPPSLVPRWATFWSVSRPDYPPLPFDPYPDLPVYLLPDGSYLLDDSTVRFPPPPGPPVNVAAAARSFLTQPNLASPMLNGAMLADDTDSTNSPPQDDDTDSTNSPPVLVDPGSVPAFGTFWLLVETNSPPLPLDPCTNCDVYLLSDGSYLIDDTSYVWPQPNGDDDGGGQGPPQTLYATGDFWLEITGVTNSLANLVLHGTTAGTPYTIMSRQSLTPDDPWDAEAPLIGATGQDWTPIQIPTFGRPVLFFEALIGSATPQRLWLYVLGISNNCFNLILQGTTEDTSFDILSTTSLLSSLSNWATETNFPGASGQFWTPVSIPLAGRPNLFLSARSNISSDGSGIPDWWEQYYFGTNGVDPYALCPSGDGWTILQAYQNGWNPTNFYTPPAPTGLTVRYYGPSTNLCVQWNPSPGPVTSYIVRRYIPALGQTNYSTFYGQTLFWDTLPSGAVDPSWPPAYQVMAQYPGGPSAWSGPVSIYSPAASLEVSSDGSMMDWGYPDWGFYDPSTTATARVVRGPQGRLYLITGHVPSGVASLRVSVSPDPDYVPSYPWSYEANYLWEAPQPFTNAPSGGSCELSATLLQSGFYELPASLAPPYGDYDVKVETVATDGSVSDCPTIISYAKDAWAFEAGAIPFLDGRRQIKENAEFQLRAAQGCAVWGPGDTNQVPFEVEQLRTTGGSSYDFSETAQVDYVTSGFHYFWADNGNRSGLPGAALVLDAFRPFEQNYFYANFLSAGPPWLTCGQSCDPQNYCTPLGIPYWPGGDWWVFEVDQPWSQFSVNAFVQSGMTNSIPDLLSPDAAQWLFLNPGPSEPIVLESFGGEFQGPSGWVVRSNFPNLYGLNLVSVQALDWGNSNATPVTYYPGDLIPRSNTASFFEVERPQLSTIDYYFARSPVITLTPDPIGPYDDEVLTLVDPRPGEPGFTTSATTPLMIAPIGRPLFLTAWAKQAILNGFTNKFAYLEQYFTNAYTIDATGNVTTNSAGLLSPYGEFFPMQPGPAALVTMADIDPPYQQGTGVVNVIKLQTDVDHNGVMDKSFAGPDNTSQTRPLVWWINNDCDWSTSSSDPGEDSDLAMQYPNIWADYLTDYIRSQRDLEDWARLWICGVPVLTSGYQVTLSWANVSSGSPAINLVNAVETNGGTLYLTDPNVGAAQASGYTYANLKYPTITTTNALTLPANLFTNAGDKYFLFEGAGIGSGQLVLTITQNSTNVIAQTGAWLDLRDVKDMFEHVHITGITNIPPGATTLTTTFTNLNWVTSAPDEDTNVIVFVHGWRMGVWNYNSFSETMFKRLYWQGYRGRFVSIRWDTLSKDDFQPIPLGRDYFTYNRSEFRAWESGSGVSACLTSLKQRFPNYNLNVCSHSLGGIVMAETLKLQLAAGQQNVNNYVLMQAAVPASCYDTSFTNYTPFITAEQQKGATPNTYWGYPGAIGGAVSGHLVDFYNTNDYALATGSLPWPIGAVNWEANQTKYKPDAGNNYWTDGTVCLYNFSTSITDPREIMSFCARPRSRAVGAQPGVGGAIQGGSVDLTANFNFRNGSDQHSAQFNWPIQQVSGFYHTLLNTLIPPGQ